ncbi:MAG TPA: hypothetical protein PKO15_04665 [Fibrobacteria bacterium]|nr:hypothetical protein [Fibrobacteria bacterium]
MRPQTTSSQKLKADPIGFPSTRWSLVGVAGQDRCQEAISDLVAMYMPALRNWLVRSKRLEPQLADDVLQAFLVDKMVSGYLFRMADRQRGKFRSLVLRALGNFSNTLLSNLSRDKSRLVVVENEDVLGVGAAPEQDDLFDFEWARALLDNAILAMESECARKGRSDLWEVFRSRVLGPALEDKPPPPYEDLVLRLGLRAPREAVNLMVTARRMFQRCLETEVSRYATSPNEIQEEINQLQAVLGRMRAL